MSQLPTNTIELLVKIQLEECSADELVTWAIEALELGFDTPSLSLLMSCFRGEAVAEVLPFFWRTLSEFGVEPLAGEALLRVYAKEIAQRVLANTLTEWQAVQLMHSRVINPLNHPSDLMNWCYLWEGNNPNDFVLLEELSDSEFATLVRKEATRFLREKQLYCDLAS
jgi:hypothetical protein